jgi:oxalate decarboxylase
VGCARCIGTPTPTNGNITSKDRDASACSGASGQARTFDFQAGDVGYVPFAMGHYIENTGTAPLRFLEMFKSNYCADLSLDTWMALTPPELLQAHLMLDRHVVDAFVPA